MVALCYSLKSETMKNIHKKLPLFIIAFSLGITISLIDSSPAWDSIGTTAAMIFIATALLGLVSPKRPWVWALIVGLWIPLYGFLYSHSHLSILALIMGFIGAYAGSIVENTLQRVEIKPISKG